MANNPITSLFSSAGSFGNRSDSAAGIDPDICFFFSVWLS